MQKRGVVFFNFPFELHNFRGLGMYKTKWYHMDFCPHEYGREFELFEFVAQMREALNPEVKPESYKNH